MTSLNIAMTGVTGFIGQATVSALTRAGHRVKGQIRPGREQAVAHLDLERVPGTMTDDPADLLEGTDVLVHNAVDWKVLKAGDLDGHLQANLLAGVHLLEQAARASLRIVLVSSVAVHHHMLSRWSGAVDHAHPGRPGNLYGALKASLEAHLWALHATHGVGGCILRPAAVYGIDPDHPRSVGWPMVQKLLAGEPWGRRGGGKFVHVDDVAAAITAGATQPDNGLHLHHLADCYARWSDWEVIGTRLTGHERVVEQLDPPAPRNMFVVDSVRQELGVPMNRGIDGIEKHIAEMIAMQRG